MWKKLLVVGGKKNISIIKYAKILSGKSFDMFI